MGRSDAITLLATEAGRQLVPASSQALLEAILTCDDLSLSLSCPHGAPIGRRAAGGAEPEAVS